jgi:alkanesulfonate monooxygenase SsuD/methylene tetrahydromethanopterin reductase-like flavin-dependent oxidoreductase (luciferase family)
MGPKNLELAGEIADGLLAIFFAPEHASDLLGHVATGRKTAGTDMTGFDVVPTVPVVIGDDLDACAEPLRHYAALYVGGMGSRQHNFYNQLAVRMGYDEAATRVQDLYLEKKHREAAAAVPFEFIDRTSLIGPRERVRDRLAAYAEAGVTTLSVASYAGSLNERVAALRTVAEVLDESGLAG